MSNYTPINPTCSINYNNKDDLKVKTNTYTRILPYGPTDYPFTNYGNYLTFKQLPTILGYLEALNYPKTINDLKPLNDLFFPNIHPESAYLITPLGETQTFVNGTLQYELVRYRLNYANLYYIHIIKNFNYDLYLKSEPGEISMMGLNTITRTFANMDTYVSGIFCATGYSCIPLMSMILKANATGSSYNGSNIFPVMINPPNVCYEAMTYGTTSKFLVNNMVFYINNDLDTKYYLPSNVTIIKSDKTTSIKPLNYYNYNYNNLLSEIYYNIEDYVSYCGTQVNSFYNLASFRDQKLLKVNYYKTLKLDTMVPSSAFSIPLIFDLSYRSNVMNSLITGIYTKDSSKITNFKKMQYYVDSSNGGYSLLIIQDTNDNLFIAILDNLNIEKDKNNNTLTLIDYTINSKTFKIIDDYVSQETSILNNLKDFFETETPNFSGHKIFIYSMGNRIYQLLKLLESGISNDMYLFVQGINSVTYGLTSSFEDLGILASNTIIENFSCDPVVNKSIRNVPNDILDPIIVKQVYKQQFTNATVLNVVMKDSIHSPYGYYMMLNP